MTPNQLPPLPDGVTLEDLLIPLRVALETCHDTDWSLRQFKTPISHALAAIAQQAQEPVAWLYVDTVGERYLCFSRPTGGGAITNLYTTPPASQEQAQQPSETLQDVMQERFDLLHLSMPDDPREAVSKLIYAETAIALDPLVSGAAEALIQRGRDEQQPSGGEVVAWAVVGRDGGVHSTKTSRESAERCAENWRAKQAEKGYAEWVCSIKPLAFATPKPEPMTDEQMEEGRERIFSVNNPYCPCDRKTFAKVARYVERFHHIGITKGEA